MWLPFELRKSPCPREQLLCKSPGLLELPAFFSTILESRRVLGHHSPSLRPIHSSVMSPSVLEGTPCTTTTTDLQGRQHALQLLARLSGLSLSLQALSHKRIKFRDQGLARSIPFGCPVEVSHCVLGLLPRDTSWSFVYYADAGNCETMIDHYKARADFEQSSRPCAK